MPQRHRGLAMDTELRPPFLNRAVVPKETACDEQVSDRRRHVLAHGEGEERGIGRHRSSGSRVSHTGHCINNQRTTVVGGNLHTRF
jgi:hypothetical protein